MAALNPHSSDVVYQTSPRRPATFRARFIPTGTQTAGGTRLRDTAGGAGLLAALCHNFASNAR